VAHQERWEALRRLELRPEEVGVADLELDIAYLVDQVAVVKQPQDQRVATGTNG
jgi:hypothetical protein